MQIAGVAGTANEERLGGALPRLTVRWPESDVLAGITTRVLNFGRHTDEPARRVADAHGALRAWAGDRFEGVVGGSQVHGTRLFRADRIVIPEIVPRSGPYSLRVGGTDGFFTATTGVLLTVGVADCVPAFLHAPNRAVVALLHAGWRGVAGGIVPAALGALSTAYGVAPQDCLAYWGPAIGPCCYPVGDEVVEAIRGAVGGAPDERWIWRGAERVAPGSRRRVDLRAALTVQAEAHGVPAGAISSSPYCTSCAEGLFHSYRRERGGGGRMLAFAGFPTRRRGA